MIIDLLILFPVIIFGALGFRDGSIRKIVAITVVIIGMFVSQYAMHDFSEFLRDNMHIMPQTAPMTAFFIFANGWDQAVEVILFAHHIQMLPGKKHLCTRIFLQYFWKRVQQDLNTLL